MFKKYDVNASVHYNSFSKCFKYLAFLMTVVMLFLDDGTFAGSIVSNPQICCFYIGLRQAFLRCLVKLWKMTICMFLTS